MDSLVCRSFSESFVANTLTTSVKFTIQARQCVGRPCVMGVKLLVSGERKLVRTTLGHRQADKRVYHSSSGCPFQTPKGHTPTWTERVASIHLRLALPLHWPGADPFLPRWNGCGRTRCARRLIHICSLTCRRSCIPLAHSWRILSIRTPCGDKTWRARQRVFYKVSRALGVTPSTNAQMHMRR